MKLGRIVDAFEKRFPPSLAEDWDNCGLIVGRRTAEIKAILVSTDLTAGVIAEAGRRRAYEPRLGAGRDQRRARTLARRRRP